MQMVLDTVCSSLIDPLVIISVDGSMNSAFLKFFGYNRWEMIGENIKIAMPEK
jgi:PAS domain S-box-containing protein